MEEVKRRVVVVFDGRTAIPRSLEKSQVTDYPHFANLFAPRSLKIGIEVAIEMTGMSSRLRVPNDSVRARRRLSQLFFPDLQDVS